MPSTTPQSSEQYVNRTFAMVAPALLAAPREGMTVKEIDAAVEGNVQSIMLSVLSRPTTEGKPESALVKSVGTRRNTDENGKTLRGRPSHLYRLTRKGTQRAQKLAKQAETQEPQAEAVETPQEQGVLVAA